MRAALNHQQLFGNDESLLDEVLERIELVELSFDDVLIGHGREERDLFVIISGKLAVIVGGREVAVCSKGDYVGEMSLIDPETRRTATVVARDKSTVGRLDEPTFTALVDKYPVLWRNLAIGMVRRYSGVQGN